MNSLIRTWRNAFGKRSPDFVRQLVVDTVADDGHPRPIATCSVDRECCGHLLHILPERGLMKARVQCRVPISNIG